MSRSTPPPPPASERLSWLDAAVLAALVAFIAFVYPGRYVVHGLPGDDGTEILSGERVARGEIPHLDFGTFCYPGLHFLLLGAVFRFLPADWTTISWLILATEVAKTAGLYLLVRRCLSIPFATLGAVGSIFYGVAFAEGLQVSWLSTLMGIAVFLALGIPRSPGRNPRVALAGLLLGLDLLVKQTTGAFHLAGALLLVAFVRLEQSRTPGPSTRGARALLVLWATVFVVCALAFQAYLGPSLRYSNFTLLLVAVLAPPLVGAMRLALGRTEGAAAPELLRGVRDMATLGLAALLPVLAWAGFYLSAGGWDRCRDIVRHCTGYYTDFRRWPVGWFSLPHEPREAAVLAGFAVAVAAAGWLGRRWTARPVRLVAVLGFAAVALHLALLGGWQEGEPGYLPRRWLIGAHLDLVQNLPIALMAVLAVLLHRERPARDPDAHWAGMAIVLLAAFNAFMIMPLPVPFYFVTCYPPAFLLAPLLARRILGPAPWRGARLGAGTAIALYVLASSAAFLSRNVEEKSTWLRFDEPRLQTWFQPVLAHESRYLCDAVRRHVGPDEPVFAPRHPVVYLATGRPNPTRLVCLGTHASPRSEDEVLLALEARRVPLVILDPPFPPKLEAYLEANYERVDRYDASRPAIEIFLRRDRVRR